MKPGNQLRRVHGRLKKLTREERVRRIERNERRERDKKLAERKAA